MFASSALSLAGSFSSLELIGTVCVYLFLEKQDSTVSSLLFRLMFSHFRVKASARSPATAGQPAEAD